MDHAADGLAENLSGTRSGIRKRDHLSNPRVGREPVEPPPDGNIEFAEAKQIAAGRMTLGGNLEVRILENESVEVVEEATRKCFEGGKERMVLKATEQPLKPMSPSTMANYHRAIDVWEELSAL